jgi:hypothetical protein
MGDTDRIERDLYAMEKEIRSLKTKLDNSIIDIRAVDFWGWAAHDDFRVPNPEKYWTVVRHEIQYKRQGSPEWVSIPLVDRDNEVNNIPIPTGELEE